MRSYPAGELISGHPRQSAFIRVNAVAFLLSLLLPTVLAAQVSPAGGWRTLHSEHFRVHFRPGTDSLARRTVNEAERAWFLLSTELVQPRQSIDLVVSDAADFANGAANVFPSNRILLLLTPPTSEPDLQNFDDWMRVVLVHELTHVFHLDRVKGPWRLMQALLGRVPGGFPNLYQPSWVSEGLATYYESRFTPRGRIRGSFHTEVLLAAARDDRWPRPNEATYISERWPDGISPYAFGSRFMSHLALTAGDSIIPRYIEKTSGQWIPFRTGRPLRLASGLNRDSTWRGFQNDYETRAGRRPGSRAEVIARGLRTQPSPAIANNGTIAWFDSPPDEPQAIVVLRPDGERKRYLTTGGVDLSWSGEDLFATRLDLTNPTTYRSDLHRLSNGDWQRITRGARLTDLSAGRGEIAAVQLSPTGNRLVIVRGDSIFPLTGSNPSFSYGMPSLSSTGDVVAIRQGPDGFKLVLMGSDGGPDWEYYQGRANETLADPTWISADSAIVLFVSDRTGLPQVYQLMLGATSPRQITDEPFGARQPVLTTDRWLYFTALESDGYALKRVRWTGNSLDEPLPPDTGFMLRVIDAPRVRETGYSPWAALRPHYFIPYLVDKGTAGYFLGAFTSGSDPVGRFTYTARLAGGLDEGRWDITAYLLYRRGNHHSADFFLSQDHGSGGVITTPVRATVVSRERDAEVGFNTAWRRWYRSVTLRVAGHLEEDRFSSSPSVEFINPKFVGASVGVAAIRTVRSPLAISDEDGAALSLRYRRRWRMDEDGWSDEWRGRLALYRSIRGMGGFAHPVLAARISAATSSGPDRETFGIGGASGVSYQPLPGIVAGSGRAFPVRGYDAGELRGRTVAVGAAELRIPISLVVEPFWDLPYGLDRVSLRLFYDYGRAWESPISGRPRWIHGTGVEVTWDLVVLYDVPLRLRTGVSVPLKDGSVTRQGDLRFGVGFGSEF
jgi:hypothetical protein